MSVRNVHQVAKRIRWAGRIIGLLVAGGWLLALISLAIVDFQAEGWEAIIRIDSILLVLLTVIAVAGCIISWWRERLAGVLLVVVSVGLGIHIGVYAGRNHFLAWLMIGLPYLVAGALLLYAWRLSRQVQ